MSSKRKPQKTLSRSSKASGETPSEKPPRTSDYKAGGETPARRFAGIKVKPGYEQKGDIERPPFESHPNHGPNKARPQHRTRDVDTAGQHGQRPTHMPRKSKKPGV